MMHLIFMFQIMNQIIKKSIEQDLSGTIDVTSDKYYEKSVLINSF